mgnify:CR=1
MPTGDQRAPVACTSITESAVELADLLCTHGSNFKKYSCNISINQRGSEQALLNVIYLFASIHQSSAQDAETRQTRGAALGLSELKPFSYKFLACYLVETFKIRSETCISKRPGRTRVSAKNNEPASTYWEADETNAQEPNRTTQLSPIRPKQAQTV